MTPRLLGTIVKGMYWVYILKSKMNDSLYVGYTHDIKKRLEEHEKGRSEATARYRPGKLVYLEGYASREDAMKREKNLKYYGKVYAQLKRRITRSISSSQKVRG